MQTHARIRKNAILSRTKKANCRKSGLRAESVCVAWGSGEKELKRPNSETRRPVFQCVNIETVFNRILEMPISSYKKPVSSKKCS